MPSNPSAATPRYVPRPERWFSTESPNLRLVPMPARSWLAWPASLTERISLHLGDRVRVQVLSERRDRLLRDERELLGIVQRTGRVREVRLEVRGQAYVVARTVFPDSTARGTNARLTQLGNRALGSLLFGSMRAPVATRQFTKLDACAPLWRMLNEQLPSDARHLWARRAVHLLRHRPLLVTEIFLPSLLPAAQALHGEGL